MDIYVKFNNVTKLIKIKSYESINSILNKCLTEFNINNNVDNYFIDYNGNYLDINNSLEKYDIKQNSLLTLNIKQKGGNSFLKFAKDNPLLVFISFIIALLPILILPTGFVPTTSSFIKTIIERSISAVGKYLVCVLGKVTLFSRVRFFLSFVKYVIFFTMIYVIITFPLVLYCITLKGNSILDNPKNMCSPVAKGSLVGLILTSIYVMIYCSYRFGNYAIQLAINLCKKVYFLNTNLNPILISLLNNYNSFKYIPFYFIPMIGGATKIYFTALDAIVNGLNIMLATVSDVGCKSKFDASAFQNLMKKRLSDFEDKKGKAKEHAIEIKSFNITDDPICNDDFKRCCNPDNFLLIGNAVSMILNNTLVTMLLKSKGIFPLFILFNEALYEYGLSNADVSNNIPSNPDDRESYLKNMLERHSDVLSDSTKYSINQYLSTFNPNLLSKIKEGIDTNFSSNISTIDQIKMKLNMLDEMMIDYSNTNNSSYIPGGTLLKTILKIFVLNSFCNVLQTTKTGSDVMDQMGDVVDISDMLKAGSASGIVVSFGYFISLIALLIMSILNKF